MSDFEQKIIDAGADKAPRITPDYIKSLIKSKVFFTAQEGYRGNQLNTKYPDEIGDGDTSLDLLTICVLTLENGFTVTGTSPCASPENSNFELGCTIAEQKATEQVWALEGYRLKQRLFEEAQTKASLADFKLDDCEGGGCKI